MFVYSRCDGPYDFTVGPIAKIVRSNIRSVKLAREPKFSWKLFASAARVLGNDRTGPKRPVPCAVAVNTNINMVSKIFASGNPFLGTFDDNVFRLAGVGQKYFHVSCCEYDQ